MSRQSGRGSKWRALRLAVLERDGWTCAHCGNSLEENHADPRHRPEADHIIPLAAGGRDVPENLVASCKRCNGQKSDQALVRIDYFNPRWFPEGFAG